MKLDRLRGAPSCKWSERRIAGRFRRESRLDVTNGLQGLSSRVCDVTERWAINHSLDARVEILSWINAIMAIMTIQGRKNI